MQILESINVFFAGLLAGAELTVRFGVRGPLAALDPEPQIRLRQGLIRTLRVLVPALYLPAFGSGLAVTALDPGGAGLGPRCAGVAALLVWTVTTFAGTVPINAAALDWQPTAPPADHDRTIRRWERLDTVRTGAAVAAFVCFLVAAR